MKARYFLVSQIAILILVSHIAFSQETGNTFAYGGPLGIYVTLGSEMPTPARAVNGGVSYLIERRVSGEQNWQQIATVSAPTSLAEFRSRLDRSIQEVAEPIPLSFIPVDRLWQMIQRYGLGDSLKVWSDVLPVRLAVGMMYFDSTAELGVHYQYRVSLVGQAHQPIRILVSDIASYPGVARLANLRTSEEKSSEHVIDIRWVGEPAIGFYTFVPYRQDGLSGKFDILNLPRHIFARRDSIFCSIIDTAITPYQIYRYYLLPKDVFGNPGVPSDTVLAGAYSAQEIPLPDSMRVMGLDSTGGLRISWTLQSVRALRDLTIYRSLDYNKGFEKLAVVTPQADYYVDQTAEPMTRYFYYIVMTDILGETSAPSAKVFGLYVSKIPPVPPIIISETGTTEGVRLGIMATDNQDAYFHVYRNDGFHGTLQLVSGSIPRLNSVTVFTDSSNALSGKVTYAYAVRAENTSHVFSGFSDTAYARPLIATSAPAPLGLTATHEGSIIQLYWDDMRPFDNALRGYLVYRRGASANKSSGEVVAISSSIIPAAQNHFADTTAQVDSLYEYAVRSVDMFGGQSTLSAEAESIIPPVKPIPPAGVSAASTQDGILVQWDHTYQPNLMEYRLYRYKRGTSPVYVATIKSSDSLEDLDSRTIKGQLYFYYLTSVNTKGVESGRSQEVGIRR